MPSLLDNFKDMEVIGTGAGSTIYKAIRADTGEVFAIKDVKWTQSGDERYLKQVANEFRVAGSFQHPNIIGVHDFQRIRRYLKTIECILVMDYFPGKMLSPHSAFSIPDLVAIFLQVARALGYMHQLGYVHTDIKPENILVNDRAHAMVVDFGVACRRGSSKVRVQGTPEFIAPEQLSKKPLDERTDIYNLGATMYKILTGKVAPENVRISVPLTNGSVPEGLGLAKLGVRHHNQAVPEKLAYVVEKCHRRSRSKRYIRVRDVEEELLACLREIAPPDHRFLQEVRA